jgi:hypothetical protein
LLDVREISEDEESQCDFRLLQQVTVSPGVWGAGSGVNVIMIIIFDDFHRFP